ncbi:acyl carrier protein [Streptomyces sp. NPDC093225]|uniref:acyl carrier protein n=1 Tax=Streptomyces sp. NPDC093225 TaxID=3366034 RepID=UPI003810A8C1
MEHFGPDELFAMLRSCAGADEGLDGLEESAGEVLDVPFLELGYDSLAILQLTGEVEARYGITLDEEGVDEAETPRRYVGLVGRALAEHRAGAARNPGAAAAAPA